MTSFRQKLFNIGARYVQKPTLAMMPHQPTLAKIFDATAALTTRRLKGCGQSFTDLDNFRIRHMAPDTADKNLLLYFHGGGFTIGSSFSHRWLAARLAARCGAQAWLPDYRLAPRHPFPAAPEDCLATYKFALETCPAERIVLAGDSAGGTLVLNTVTRAQAEGLPQPAAIGLLSPIVDLTSPASDIPSEMLLPAKWVNRSAALYLGQQDPTNPDVSPIHADLSVVPPCALHAAEGEMLFNHARHLEELLPEVDFQIWENVPHVWQIAAGWTTEADASLHSMAAYFRAHLP